MASTKSSDPSSPSRKSKRSKTTSHQRRTSSTDTTTDPDGDKFRDSHGLDLDFQEKSTEKPQTTSEPKNKQGPKSAAKSGKQATPGTRETKAGGKQKNKNDTTETAEGKIKQLGKDLRTAKQEIKEFKKECTSARIRIAELKNQVDSYHNDHLELVSKDKVEAELDAELDTKFKGIFNDTRDISKAWGFPDWSKVDIPELEKVFSNLSGVSARPFATDRLLLAVKDKKIPLRVVLSAFINKEICTETFARPFAHLEFGLHGQDDEKTEMILERIMGIAEKKSPNSQHKLRATILRAIDDFPMERSQWVESWAQQALSIAQVERCRHVTQSIFQKVGMLLKEVTNEEQAARDTQMLQVVESAMRLSGILNMQFPKIQFFFLNDLTETNFSLKDTHFQLDQALHIDESDEGDRSKAQALESQPIDMVVEPAVARYGNKNGEDYETGNVVSRGSVWIVQNNKSVSQEAATCRPAERLSNDEGGDTSGEGSTALSNHAPKISTLDLIEAGERSQSAGNATKAPEMSYNICRNRQPTKKADEGKIRGGGRQNESKHQQGSTRNPEQLEPTANRPATSKQPERPLDDEVIWIDSDDCRSASQSDDRADLQTQTTDSAASSTQKTGAQLQLQPTNPDQGPKRSPPKQGHKQGKKGHCPRGETGTESESGDAAGSPEGVDHSHTSYVIASPDVLSSSSPSAVAFASDQRAESVSNQGDPDQHFKKRKLSTSKVGGQPGDEKNLENIQPVKRQAKKNSAGGTEVVIVAVVDDESKTSNQTHGQAEGQGHGHTLRADESSLLNIKKYSGSESSEATAGSMGHVYGNGTTDRSSTTETYITADGDNSIARSPQKRR
ncbi:hypothetical protein AYL99_02841 [Fonsecaea erecta]|uniref:Uncharacterized protein n=1 Tax=Fonsecaea erecta TaxID=1367422 RepID=A0A178ZV07_9EURO|nr:hypothetical protein AYL99_02841 [Fonsecaea erecta]OAP63614.1 hypothetical protein AYL99_02841 [Fonsecaea erecta]